MERGMKLLKTEGSFHACFGESIYAPPAELYLPVGQSSLYVVHGVPVPQQATEYQMM